MKAKIIPFRKNINLSRFNVAPAEWRKIRTSGDKKLSSSEIELLWTIYRLATHHRTDNLQLSYAVLGKECALDTSQRTLNRYLHKLSSTGIIQFYTTKSAVNYDKILTIKIDFEILENPLSVRFGSQVCQSNLTGYNKDKNKPKSKEEEERDIIYLSSSSKKERNKNKKEKEVEADPHCHSDEQCQIEETQPQNNDQSNGLLCYPEGAASHSDYPNEKQEEEAMKAHDLGDPSKKLDLAIASNFNTAIAQELSDCVDFRYSENENKMRLFFKEKLAISEQNKGLLRQLIKSVYGDNVEIVCKLPKADRADVISLVQEEFSSNERIQSNTADFSQNRLWRKGEGILVAVHGKVPINDWFPRMKITEEGDKIIFDTSDSNVEQATRRFQSTLMKVSGEIERTLRFIGRSQVQAGKVDIIEITKDAMYTINQKKEAEYE